MPWIYLYRLLINPNNYFYKLDLSKTDMLWNRHLNDHVTEQNFGAFDI